MNDLRARAPGLSRHPDTTACTTLTRQYPFAKTTVTSNRPSVCTLRVPSAAIFVPVAATSSVTVSPFASSTAMAVTDPLRS